MQEEDQAGEREMDDVNFSIVLTRSRAFDERYERYNMYYDSIETYRDSSRSIASSLLLSEKLIPTDHTPF